MEVEKLNQSELQEIVCMTGSKKAFGVYVGREGKKLNALWTTYELKSPTKYMWSLTKVGILRLNFRMGSWQATAKYLGVSYSSFRKYVVGKYEEELVCEPDWEDKIEEKLERYGSIKLTARIMRLSEKEIREWMGKHGKSTLELLGEQTSNLQGAKGRRAELDAMAWRGEQVVEDLNITQGTHAKADFIDSELGIVNVKSSREFRYKAWKKRFIRYWKFSTAGLQNCDTVLLVFYDAEGENPTFETRKSSECGGLKTFYVNRETNA